MKKIVVLTGAGISAESGLKTFRDSDGLWQGYNIEDVATPRAFAKNPELVLEFYNMRRREVAKAQPNDAHLFLKDLEKDFEVTIVTQNIDDLHERAGSQKVIHLHGEIFRMCAVNDKSKTFPIKGDIKVGDVAPNGQQLRPFIVWFEEAVPMMEIATDYFRRADIFILIGTSLQVYPAAGLMNYLNAETPKFILDKNLPPVKDYTNIFPIEQPATQGITALKQYLEELK